MNVKGVAEVFLHGDSLESFTVVVLVPEKKYVEEWAKEQGM